jgi:ribosomal protein S18 acetylase RimI-like enzyme
MKIEFQRFHTSDLSFAWNLYQSLMKSMTERLLPWDPDKQLSMIQEALQGGNMQLILFNGERAGWMETQEDSARIYLAHLYIKPELQGKGIGTRALSVLIEQAEAAHKSLSLSVMKNNPTKAFYEKRGFEVVGDERFKYHMTYIRSNPFRNPAL